MPPTFSARCWAALCAKWPDLAQRDEGTAHLIIDGAYQAFDRVLHDPLKQDRDVNGIPPTRVAVSDYFRNLGHPQIWEDFYDYYEAKGWTIGASTRRMKNWHAAAKLWIRREERGPARSRQQGAASLFALQTQLKTIETELESILYPGGSQFKVTPQGKAFDRYTHLMAQRKGIIERIDSFSS